MLLVIRKKDENDFMNSQIITLNTRRSLKDHFERSMFTLCSPREERAPTNFVGALSSVWTSQGLNLGPPDYEPQITIFMILYDM